MTCKHFCLHHDFMIYCMRYNSMQLFWYGAAISLIGNLRSGTRPDLPRSALFHHHGDRWHNLPLLLPFMVRTDLERPTASFQSSLTWSPPEGSELLDAWSRQKSCLTEEVDTEEPRWATRYQELVWLFGRRYAKDKKTIHAINYFPRLVDIYQDESLWSAVISWSPIFELGPGGKAAGLGRPAVNSKIRRSVPWCCLTTSFIFLQGLQFQCLAAS